MAPAVVAALVTFHAVTVLFAYRLRNTTVGTSPATVENPHTCVVGDSLECPTCGTTNDRGYRFCKGCVGELS